MKQNLRNRSWESHVKTKKVKSSIKITVTLGRRQVQFLSENQFFISSKKTYFHIYILPAVIIEDMVMLNPFNTHEKVTKYMTNRICIIKQFFYSQSPGLHILTFRNIYFLQKIYFTAISPHAIPQLGMHHYSPIVGSIQWKQKVWH